MPEAVTPTDTAAPDAAPPSPAATPAAPQDPLLAALEAMATAGPGALPAPPLNRAQRRAQAKQRRRR